MFWAIFWISLKPTFDRKFLRFLGFQISNRSPDIFSCSTKCYASSPQSPPRSLQHFWRLSPINLHTIPRQRYGFSTNNFQTNVPFSYQYFPENCTNLVPIISRERYEFSTNNFQRIVRGSYYLVRNPYQ